MRHAAGIAGKIRLQESVDVTDRAIDDEAGDAHRPRAAHHDLADKGLGQVAAAIDDEDVAGTQQLIGAVQGLVVTGPGLDRHRRAEEPAGAMIGAQRPRAVQAVHHVGDDRDLGAPESVEDRAWNGRAARVVAMADQRHGRFCPGGRRCENYVTWRQ